MTRSLIIGLGLLAAILLFLALISESGEADELIISDNEPNHVAGNWSEVTVVSRKGDRSVIVANDDEF